MSLVPVFDPVTVRAQDNTLGHLFFDSFNAPTIMNGLSNFDPFRRWIKMMEIEASRMVDRTSAALQFCAIFHKPSFNLVSSLENLCFRFRLISRIPFPAGGSYFLNVFRHAI